ncbi:MAG TPA: D-aminoacylase, partial [Spirochaetota bacterium]|nr:D-aminoacylase [Spirochaetota bacterium]
ERFGVKKRGLLREGYAADITIFDWKSVRDNNTDKNTNTTPSGIEAVFINGRKVVDGGTVNGSIQAGILL